MSSAHSTVPVFRRPRLASAGLDTLAESVEPPAWKPARSPSLKYLHDLRRSLRDGEKLRKDVQKELMQLAHGEPSSLKTRLARVILEDHADYEDAYEMWQAEAGDPLAYLERQHQRLVEDREKSADASPPHWDVWPKFVDELERRPLSPLTVKLARELSLAYPDEPIARRVIALVPKDAACAEPEKSDVDLLLSDNVRESYPAASRLTELFEKEPDKIAPTIRSILEKHKLTYLQKPVQNVVKAAGPPQTPEHREWLTGFLFQPRGGMDGAHLMRSQEDFDLAFELLGEAPPEATEHLLDVKNEDRVADLLTHDFAPTWPLDPEPVLGALEKHCGTLDELPLKDKAGLALLHNLGREKERLYRLLQPHLEERPQSFALRRILDAGRLRAMEETDDLMHGLRLNQLLAEELPESPFGHICEPYEDQDPTERSRPLLERLPPSPELIREVTNRYSGDLADLNLLLHLAESDPELDRKLFHLLKDGDLPKVAQSTMNRWAQQETERVVAALPTLELPERIQALEETMTLAEKGEGTREAHKLLRKTFLQTVPQEMQDLELLKEIASDPDGWKTGQERYLGFHQLLREDALEAYRIGRQARAEGLSWETAHQLALGAYVHAPGEGRSGLHDGPDRLTVGGVTLRKRPLRNLCKG